MMDFKAGDTIECNFGCTDTWYVGTIVGIDDGQMLFYSREAERDGRGHNGNAETKRRGFWWAFVGNVGYTWRPSSLQPSNNGGENYIRED